LNAYGVLPRANFVERNGLELKGQFVGQTAPTVKQAVADAMGGTLFIDEAYALVDGGGDRFSGEAVRTLLTEVENNRTALMVVLAGYKDKMENLMMADEGLPRRFQRTLHLDDYTPAELAQICTKVAHERFSLSIDPELERAIELHLSCMFSNGPCPVGSPSPCHNCQLVRKQNGGLAVNLVERAFKRLAQRVIRTNIPRNSPLLSCLAREDFEISSVAATNNSRFVALPLTASKTLAGSGRLRSEVQNIPTDLLRFMKDLPAEQLLRLVRGIPSAERRPLAEQQCDQGPRPPPLSSTKIAVDIALDEKPKAKRKAKREYKREEDEAEEEDFQEKLDDEEDVETDVLERLKDIGVRSLQVPKRRVSWDIAVCGCLAEMRGELRMVRHEWEHRRPFLRCV
jgi:SpoVK/Ycf46/Vps4 family AAA+-type ATPase